MCSGGGGAAPPGSTPAVIANVMKGQIKAAGAERRRRACSAPSRFTQDAARVAASRSRSHWLPLVPAGTQRATQPA